jgi:nitrilase
MKVKVAAVQAAPVYLDRQATIEKAGDLVADAARSGARLAVLPEAFVPTYPDWVWYLKPGDPLVDDLYARLLDQSVAVPSAACDALGAIARKNKIYLAVGVNESDAHGRGATVYNTLLYFSDDGTLLGKHRKLMPTNAERMVWGFGDGSTLLQVHPTPFGRLGGLLCWENYMPLARTAVYAQGVDIWCAPTWDRGDAWTATLVHIAREGRVVVIGVAPANNESDIPDGVPGKGEVWPAGKWICEGGSAIVDPWGEILAGPVMEREETLIAAIDTDAIASARRPFDVVGHYARADVLRLVVNTEANTPVAVVQHGDGPQRERHAPAGEGPQ